MQKHYGYLILNIAGLTIGLTSFLLISFYVINEMSFDGFHNNYENIYRIKVKVSWPAQQGQHHIILPNR